MCAKCKTVINNRIHHKLQCPECGSTNMASPDDHNNEWSMLYDAQFKIRLLEYENEKLKKDTKEAVNTTWRFIGAYKKENDVPIKLALKSAEYHLKQIDYIF